MFIYIIAFLASTAIFFQAKKADSLKLQWSLIILAILPVAIVAGVRDDNIGTDVLVYGRDCFLDAAASTYYTDIDLSWMLRFEPGYLMLNYIVSRFTSDHHVFLGILMGIQMLFIMAGLLHFKDKIPVEIALFIYYFSYYNISLNQLRQSFACAIIFFAFSFTVKKKLLPFLLFVGLACAFHISAFLAFTLYPVYTLIEKKQSVKFVMVTITIGVILSFIVQKSIDHVLAILNLSSVYAHYFKDSQGGFFITRFLMTLPIPLTFLYFRKETTSHSNISIFILFSLWVMVVATQAREYIGNDAERILTYFAVFQILGLPLLLNSIKDKLYNNILKYGGLLYYIGFWYYMFILNRFQETYPYTSHILNRWI